MAQRFGEIRRELRVQVVSQVQARVPVLADGAADYAEGLVQQVHVYMSALVDGVKHLIRMIEVHQLDRLSRVRVVVILHHSAETQRGRALAAHAQHQRVCLLLRSGLRRLRGGNLAAAAGERQNHRECQRRAEHALEHLSCHDDTSQVFVSYNLTRGCIRVVSKLHQLREIYAKNVQIPWKIKTLRRETLPQRFFEP